MASVFAMRERARNRGRFVGHAVALVIVVVLAACGGHVSASQGDAGDRMERLSKVVMQLARSAQAALGAQQVNPDDADGIIRAALARNANDRKEVEDYQLRTAVLRDEKGRWRPVMLLCTKDGGQALIERMDCQESALYGQHWRAEPPMPCEVTIREVRAVCPQK